MQDPPTPLGHTTGPRGLSVEERRSLILQMLDRDASVQVAEVAQAFGVSRVTVRGDLDALERMGKLRRTHGGAASLAKTLTVSIQDTRVNVNVEAKRAIARAAAGLVGDGESLLVDSGTTALEFVRCLGAKSGITVVTADFTIGDFIDRSLPGVDVVMLGGALRKGHRYAYGPLTLRSLEMLHPDRTFVCPTSYVPGRGLMTNFAQMAEVKQAMMHACESCTVLLDSSKVGGSGLVRFADVDEADVLVSDADPEGALAAALDGTGCELVIAPNSDLAASI